LVLGNALEKAVLKPAFPHKSKVAFPKTEVLGKPHYMENKERGVYGKPVTHHILKHLTPKA
jgi:hypothetical protein